MKSNVFFILLLIYFMTSQSYGEPLNLIAYFSQHGLHGEIKFHQLNKTTVEITTDLETTLQYPDQIWSWAVRKFPVDYTNPDANLRCAADKLGEEVMSFDSELDYLVLPGNETSSWHRNMPLIGERGIWGRSLVLTETTSNARICATIITLQAAVEHIAEARFNSPIAGSVYFRWLATTDQVGSDTVIYSDLYHIKAQPSIEDIKKPETLNHWKIFVTDIFKNDHHRSEDNCNFLQIIFVFIVRNICIDVLKYKNEK